VIVDRDGTAASCRVRPDDSSKISWAAFNAALPFDALVPEVAALCRSFREGVALIMTSGRAEGDHPGDRRRFFLMKDWLYKYRDELPVDYLFMRSGGDQRRDSIVKKEIYKGFIEPYFDVRFAIDDRPQIVDLWRELGIPVLAVTDPEIDPPILRSI